MKYLDEKIECMDRKSLKKLQSERLLKTLKRVYDNVPTYRAKMDEKGIKVEDIKGVEDLSKLPFTVKQDLRANYPFGMFASPRKDIIRVHASSGTTGKLTVVGYTKNDIECWADVMARAMSMAGADQSSVINVAYGYGLFTGGLGAHYGAERLGAITVPVSTGNTKKQLMLMKDFGTNFICCTPSYAIYLAECMEKEGIKPSDLQLKAGIFGAEVWTEEMRQEIQKRLNIKAYDIYGLSEIIGPGVAMECEAQNGMHFAEDHFIPEIIDPVTLEPLPYGEKGELVITTITKEGIPLIRYRTRDITNLIDEPCSCGRTHVRMGKVQGRSDDMLIIRGVNVFPSQIESVLMQYTDFIMPNYLIVVDRVNMLDKMQIQLELIPSLFTDEIKKIEKLVSDIKADLFANISINAEIKIVESGTIQRSEGKSVRVIDNRVI